MIIFFIFINAISKVNFIHLFKVVTFILKYLQMQNKTMNPFSLFKYLPYLIFLLYDFSFQRFIFLQINCTINYK